MLQDININTIHAENGIEAIKLCSNNNIKLVLMDIQMPIMNGIEATKEIKKIRPNLPIIAQSAYSTTVNIDDAINAGCIDFLPKPINEKDLIDIIKKYLFLKI